MTERSFNSLSAFSLCMVLSCIHAHTHMRVTATPSVVLRWSFVESEPRSLFHCIFSPRGQPYMASVALPMEERACSHIVYVNSHRGCMLCVSTRIVSLSGSRLTYPDICSTRDTCVHRYLISSYCLRCFRRSML